jgi:hypothetical protein
MQSTKLYFWLCLFVFVLVAGLLISGHPVLLYALMEDPYLPAGNILTWAGIIALPTSIFLGIRRLQNPETRLDIVFSKIIIFLIFVAILWAPVSFLLAGNLSNSFSEKATFQGGQEAMRLFWSFSYFSVGAPLVCWVVYWIFRWFGK